MFSIVNGQAVPRVMVNHIRNGQKSAREVAEHELTGIGISFDPHVHKAFGTPANAKHQKYQFSKPIKDLSAFRLLWPSSSLTLKSVRTLGVGDQRF